MACSGSQRASLALDPRISNSQSRKRLVSQSPRQYATLSETWHLHIQKNHECAIKHYSITAMRTMRKTDLVGSHSSCGISFFVRVEAWMALTSGRPSAKGRSPLGTRSFTTSTLCTGLSSNQQPGTWSRKVRRLAQKGRTTRSERADLTSCGGLMFQAPNPKSRPQTSKRRRKW